LFYFVLKAVQISVNNFFKKSAQKIWKSHFECNIVELQRVTTQLVFFSFWSDLIIYNTL